MATTSSARRNAPTGGHGLGQGSGSGAGQWLSSVSLNPSIDSVERELGDVTEAAAPSGRTYRISAAEVGNRNSAAPDDLFLKLNPSGSGEVDLDLSFDFVSQLENTRPSQTPIKDAIDSPVKQNGVNGMSTAKRWGGNSHRKQPPSAINFLKKKQHLAANDLTSQFSPISPLDHKRDDKEDEPLTMMKIGASKRAVDSGIVNSADENNRAALIRQQRSMAQMKQLNSKNSPKKKTILGENKAMLNAQIGQPEQNNDVFDDVAYHKYLLTSDIVPMAPQPQTNKRSAAPNMDNRESTRPSDNALGLTHLGEGPTGLGLTIRQEYHHSPMGTQTTTSPALSELFSDSGTVRGSEFTHGSISEGATTPGTAFSTLFDDRHNDFKVATSTQMERGPSAPVSSRPLVNDIMEEDRLSMVRSTTAPSSTFEPERHSNDFLEASTSDLGSSPIKGAQQMILSTADSMTDDTKFLFRHPGQQSKGVLEGPANNLAHGLGIDMGHFEDKDANQLQLDLSELSVERAMLPEVALDLGDMGREEAFVPSQSFSSSAEGFAINTTPMAYKQPDLKIHLPTTIDELSPRESTSKTPRWKTKFWNMTGKSPLSSLRRNGQETDKTPTMKSLLLVNRSKDQDMGPLSAPLPSAATFAPNLQMPPAALHSESRYSKSSIMTSRFRYLPNEEGHIQVAVDTPEMDERIEVRSPKKITTPMNILTPKMEYIRSARNRRHSWGYSSDASLLETPTWLTAAAQIRGNSLLRNSTLSAVGNEDPSINLLQAPMRETIVEDGIRRRVRHRATNSVPVSPSMLPDTWTSPHPDRYHVNEPEEEVVESAQRARFHHDAQLDQEYYELKRRTRTKTFGSRMSIFGPASIAITPYLVGLTGTRNRSKMVKTTSLKPSVYSKTEGQTQVRLFSDDGGVEEGLFAYSGRALENASPSKSLFFAGFLAMPWLWFIGGWGLQIDGTIYIDRDLFWQQENEEVIKIELLRRRNFATTKAAYASGFRYNQQSILPMHRDSVLVEDPDPINKDNTNERYSMDRPESFIQIIDRNHHTHITRPQSLMERSSWMQDDTVEDHNVRRAPRARSLLLGEERNSIQPMSLQEFRNSIALDQMNANDVMHPVDLGYDEEENNVGIAYSTNDQQQVDYYQKEYPRSQFDQFDEIKEKKKKRYTFFDQIIEANSQMMNKLAIASARVKLPTSFQYQTKREQQQQQQFTTHVESKSIVSILFDDWTKLERFVLLNRIMALTMSIIVFGAAGVAIWVVVADW